MNPVDELSLWATVLAVTLVLGGWLAVAVVALRRDWRARRAAMRAELRELEGSGLKELHSLLNVIHAEDDYYAQDPRFGSYTRKHGLRRSIRDATQVVYMLRAEWTARLLDQMKIKDRLDDQLKYLKGK